METVNGVTEVEVSKLEAGVHSVAVTAYKHTADRVILGGKSNALGAYVLAVCIVVSDNGIGNRIKRNADSEVGHRSEHILCGNGEGLNYVTVEAGCLNSISAVAIIGGLSELEEHVLDRTFVIPHAGSMTLCKLHNESCGRALYVCADIEGNETNSIVSGREVLPTGGSAGTNGSPELHSVGVTGLEVIAICCSSILIKLVVATAIYTSVGYDRICSRNSVAAVRKCSANGCTADGTSSGSCTSSLSESVRKSLAGCHTADGTSSGSCTSSLAPVVLVRNLQTVKSITEYKVIEHEAAVLTLSVTGYVKCSDIVSSDIHITGVRTDVFIVNVVSKCDGIVVVELNKNNNVYPTGPTVLKRKLSNLAAILYTAAKGDGCLISGFSAAEAEDVDITCTPTCPVCGVVSRHSKNEGEVVVTVGAGNTGVDTEGKEAGSIVCTREGIKIAVRVVGRIPELTLKVLVGVVDHGVYTIVNNHAELVFIITYILETVHGSTVIVVALAVNSIELITIGTSILNYLAIGGFKIVVRKCLANSHATILTGCGSRTGSLGEVVRKCLAYPTTGTGCRLVASGSLGNLVLLTIEGEVTLYGVTVCKVIHVVTGACFPSVKVDVQAGKCVGGYGVSCRTNVKESTVDEVVCVDNVLSIIKLEVNLNVEPFSLSLAFDKLYRKLFSNSISCLIGSRLIPHRNVVTGGNTAFIEDRLDRKNVNADTVLGTPVSTLMNKH